jgi:hypothetical protein
MFNVKEIIEAWIISHNPTKSQLERANDRGVICDECPSKKTTFKDKKWSAFCSECGCPISKKIFTNSYNPCPLKKWELSDKKYEDSLKKDKTII